jgi:hypothetical protein
LLIEIALVLLGIAEPVRPNQIDGEAIMVDERGLSAFDLLCSWRNCALPYAVGRAFSNNAPPEQRTKKSPGIPAEAELGSSVTESLAAPSAARS